MWWCLHLNHKKMALSKSVNSLLDRPINWVNWGWWLLHLKIVVLLQQNPLSKAFSSREIGIYDFYLVLTICFSNLAILTNMMVKSGYTSHCEFSCENRFSLNAQNAWNRSCLEIKCFIFHNGLKSLIILHSNFCSYLWFLCCIFKVSILQNWILQNLKIKRCELWKRLSPFHCKHTFPTFSFFLSQFLKKGVNELMYWYVVEFSFRLKAFIRRALEEWKGWDGLEIRQSTIY